MHRFKLLSLFIFSLTSLLANQKHVDHYGTNSLIQGGIVDLKFDKIGFLWIVTNEGLLRFDGVDVKEFNKNNYPTIKDSRFGNFDNEGIITSETGKLYDINFHYGKPIFVNKRRKLFANVWFKSEFEKSKFIKKYRLENLIRDLTNKKQKLRKFFFYKINTKEGFLCGESVLFSSKQNTKEINFNKSMYGLKNGVFSNVFYSNNPITEKVSFYNSHGKKDVTAFFHTKEILNKINKERTFFHVAENNNIFLVVGNSLYKLAYDGQKFYSKLITNELNINNICSLDYLEKENVIAVGSFSEGLFIIKENYFSSIQCSKVKKNYIEYACIPSFENNILLSSGALYNTLTKKSISLLNLENDSRSYLIDKNNNLWYFNKGFIHILNSNRKLKYEIELKKQNISTNQITKFYEDENGFIWFCNDRFLGKINPYNYSITGHNHFNLYKDEFIESFHLINQKHILIGTNKRAIELNTKTRRNKTVLFNKHIRSFNQDRDKDIWIGSYGDGFFLFRDDRIFKIPIDSQNLLSSVHGVLLDRFDRLWISSNKGIFTIDKNKILKSKNKSKKFLKYSRYTTFDGLPGNEFNGGCYPSAFEYKGDFYFPSMNGLIHFDPNNFWTRKIPLKIIPNSFKCDGEILQGDIILNPDFGRITFDFSIPYWSKNENIKIEYKLLNSSKDNWYQLARREKIIISNLAAGDYKMLIRVSNDKGEKIDFYETKFTVLPFYYQTKWFYFFSSILIIIVLYLLYKARVKLLIKEKQLLKKKVSKQVEEIYNANKDLELAMISLQESNEKLEWSNYFRAKLVSVFIHDLKSPLHFLSKVTKRIKDNPDSIDKKEFQDTSSELYNYSVSIISYIDQFLVWQTVNQNNWNLNIKPINTLNLFNSLKIAYDDIVKKHNNEIQILVDSDLYIETDEELLKIILRNLIDNANKNSNCIFIRLLSKDMGDHKIIKVQDNGCGLSKETILELKNNMNSGLLGKSHEKIGYKIIGDFCQLLKITVEIESEGNEMGTSITLKIPNP